MDELDYFDEEDSAATVFRDVILLTLIGFVAMVIMLLPHIRKTTEQQEDQNPPGNVIVEMRWPNDMNLDVDLWVKGPNVLPVGFWNQGNSLFNLLRDDLGTEGDATGENYEVTYSRGIAAGEYIVNAHMYGPLTPGATVPVSVVVSIRREHEHTRQILSTTLKIEHHNQEKTAFRFRLNKEGDLIKDSVSTLDKPLITSYSK